MSAAGRPGGGTISALGALRAAPTGRELLIIAALLPLVVLAGSAMTAANAEVGAAKAVWIVLALAAGIVALADLRAGLMLLVLAIGFPFRTELFFGVELHTTHLLLLVLAVQVLVSLAVRQLVAPRGLLAPALLTLFGAVLASIAGPEPADSLFRLGNGLLLPMLAGLAAATALRPHRDLPALTIAVAVALSAVSVLTLLQAGDRVPEEIAPRFIGNRTNGLFLHANILGAFLATSIVLLVGVAGQAWRRFALAPLLFLPPIFLGIAALVTTLSRAAVLGLAAGIVVVLAAMLARRQIFSAAVVLSVVGLTLLVAVPLIPESRIDAFRDRLDDVRETRSEVGRDDIYRQARITIGQHPVTGVGPLTFGTMVEERKEVPGVKDVIHAHSVLFDGYLSLGPLGLLGLIWLIGAAIARLARATAERAGRGDAVLAGWATGVLGALAALVVEGTADFPYWQVEITTFLFLLIGSGFAIGATAARRSDGAQA